MSGDSHGQGEQGAGGAMGARGVTRPMAREEISGDRGADSHDGDSGGAGGHSMSHDDRLQMLRQHHKATLWIYWTLPLLGIWMLAAPVTFGYLNEALWVDPSGGRGAWFSDQTHTELRARLMTISDIASGLLLLVFGWRALTPGRPISLWICCFVGIWLTFAPVVLWAPTAAGYLNDSIVGALLIALTVLIPGMPGMIMFMQMGGDQPEGWTYNPSSWPQRWIMIVLGFLGFIVSRYLAAFQLGYLQEVWDPFFGESSRRVLDSKMSHMWPISDGGLGGVSYTFEFLMGYMGAPSRWRTMPWMVTFFGILVIPLGLTHIILVISQPVVVGAWCTLCLLAAAIMLPMIPLEMDEVVAMLQHLRQAKRRGDRGGSLWAIFWKGGQAGEATHDQRSPELMSLPDQPGKVLAASIWGMSTPWTLVASAAIGVWLMFAPSALGMTAMSAHIAHLGGALVVTISVIAMGEIVRTLRLVNILLGLILAIGPWVADGAGLGAQLNATACGLAAAALALPRGRITERYGAWTAWIR